MFHKIFKFAGLLLVAAAPGLAQAADVPPAVQAFLANVERQTAAKPSYDALKDDGAGNVTITNLTLTKPVVGDTPGFTWKTAEVTFTGITDQGGSLYEIGKASFSNTTMQMTGKDAALAATMPNATAEGWYIRAVGATPTPKEQLLSTATFARHAASGPISITAGGQTLSIDGIEATWNGDPKTGAGAFSLKVNNIAVPEAAVALMDQSGMLKQLGYPSLNFDITTDGDLSVKEESIGYAFKVGLAGRNMGAFKFAAAVDDVPLSAYAAMLKAQSDGKPVDFQALAPELQNVLVKSASLRFEDASIFKKLLPIMAAMQGMDEKTLVASIPPTLQLTLIQFQNEAFTKQAVDAVTRFLADPKSFTISIAPSAPLKVSEFEALDPNKPGDAITKLGVSVSAND